MSQSKSCQPQLERASKTETERCKNNVHIITKQIKKSMIDWGELILNIVLVQSANLSEKPEVHDYWLGLTLVTVQKHITIAGAHIPSHILLPWTFSWTRTQLSPAITYQRCKFVHVERKGQVLTSPSQSSGFDSTKTNS